MNILVVNSCAFILLLSAVLFLSLRLKSRSSLDVLLDLEDDFERQAESCENPKINNNMKKYLHGFTDICEKSLQQKITIRIQWLLPVFLAVTGFISVVLIEGISSAKIPLVSMIGLSIGYLIRNLIIRKARGNYYEEIERGLPLIMEELVMAVSAGHDVISALKIILSNRNFARIDDPLTSIFKMLVELSEAGLGFTDSLKQVGRITPVPAIKHALIHLSLAYQEGGELIMPLRELADATQLMYQEKMEERVAKLPVKATMPLVLIFSGLVIFFVATPIIQVAKVTSSGVNFKGAKQ